MKAVIFFPLRDFLHWCGLFTSLIQLNQFSSSILLKLKYLRYYQILEYSATFPPQCKRPSMPKFGVALSVAVAFDASVSRVVNFRDECQV